MTVVMQIILRATAEPDFRELLFTDFDGAVAEYSLNQRDSSWLRGLSRRDFEGIVGRLFAHLFVPIRASCRVLVIPAGRADIVPGPADIPVWLAPSLVFGNGMHETTRVTLQLVEDLLRPGDRVLDLGVGTAIQSIAAIKLGAVSALGLDTDPVAVEMARENLRLNHVEGAARAELGSLVDVLGNAFHLPNSTFDLIVANILTPVILEFMHQGISRALTPTGRLIVSGIRQQSIPRILRALPAARLVEIGRQIEGRWAALALRQARQRPLIERFFLGG